MGDGGSSGLPPHPSLATVSYFCVIRAAWMARDNEALAPGRAAGDRGITQARATVPSTSTGCPARAVLFAPQHPHIVAPAILLS